MLDQTFVHVQGIGPATERRLWASGFSTWDACFQNPNDLPLGPAARRRLLGELEASRAALAAGDSRYFASALQPRDHWRGIRHFRRVGYLDIETDGGTTITVIGLYDGVRVRQYVRGDNLDVFPEEVEGYDALVTFFGSGFDLPMLRMGFPGLTFDALHVDLCYALRRLGYRGGLKAIEERVGIHRGAQTHGLDGWDAVRLWMEYRAGSEDSLATLLAYNSDDIVNLEPLLDLAYEGLCRQARDGEERG
jgi:uncharacterized protein YprB with RNaseH-like and TPR domain